MLEWNVLGFSVENQCYYLYYENNTTYKNTLQWTKDQNFTFANHKEKWHAIHWKAYCTGWHQEMYSKLSETMSCISLQQISSMVFRAIIMCIILSNLHLSGHLVYRELLLYSCLLILCILELYDPWQKHALNASYFAKLLTFLNVLNRYNILYFMLSNT